MYNKLEIDSRVGDIGDTDVDAVLLFKNPHLLLPSSLLAVMQVALPSLPLTILVELRGSS